MADEREPREGTPNPRYPTYGRRIDDYYGL